MGALRRFATSEARRHDRDDGGQISLLAVLGAAAFACLLVLVVDTGWATSEKVALQSAADASALSGGTWVARGLNVISLDNVTQTQLLALAIIIPATQRAIQAGLVVLEAELAACAALVVGAPVCAALVEAQIFALELLQVPVTWAQAAARPPNGLLWLGMKALGYLSGLVAQVTPVMAQAEAYRIAGVNAEQAQGIVLSFSKVPLLPDMPVRRGRFADLCQPTRTGTPAAHPERHGYTPLLGYDLDQGPLKRYGRYVFWGLTIAAPTSLADVFFEAFEEVNYRALCGAAGGGSTQGVEAPVSTLEECRARGGTGYWEHVDVRLVTDRPDPGIVNAQLGAHDPRIEGSSSYRFQVPCSWSPPPGYVRSGPRTWRKTRPGDPQVEPLGQGRARYHYQVEQLVFLRGGVQQTPQADPSLAQQPETDRPFPYLLGYAGETMAETQQRLNYLGVVHRRQGVFAAPGLFVDGVWQDHRLAYAQSRVFNGTAFDTFTQDWQVKLVPAEMLEHGSLASLAGAPPAPGSGVQADWYSTALSAVGDLDRWGRALVNNH